MRAHRAIKKRAKKIDPTRAANQAEYVLESLQVYKSILKDIRGIASSTSIRKLIKDIDKLENEVIRLENRIDTLEERRRIKAARLEEKILNSIEVAQDYLTPEEFKDFRP